jgi:hypothetical protein
MTNKEKNVLAGAGLGFLAGVGMTGLRYAAAATAPFSYPTIGGVTAAISAASVVMATKDETGFDFKEPSHVAVASLAVAAATIAGGVWGTLCIPTAVVEPVLAPCTAIPACTIGGAILANQ